ncbi:MAG: EAL domain-containing protein [Proteobacteria bacterium]|nr:MAG: EAL domain-containing protein [Pseudomonadota bacterium]
MSVRPRILLVDDAPDNVLVLGRALEVVYEVQFATSGEAALALVARRAPDLILLDVVMPGMDGIQVLRRLRANEPTRDIPVILVSADVSEQTQIDGLDVGADDYLTKPVITSVLQARVRNVLQRKRAERQLRLASLVFRHSGEAIMVTDRDNRIIDINPAFTRLTGYSLDEVRGKNPRMLASGRTSREEYEAMWSAVLNEGLWQGEIWDRNKAGEIQPKLLTISVVRSPEGGVENFIAIFTDISERKAAQEHIEFLAHHDSLTGLPNRLMLKLTLEHALAHQQRSGCRLAVMFIDLDRFKEINDSLGHPVGDGLLLEVAQRLSGGVRESDTVARLGGDEFVVVLDDADAEVAARVARQLVKALGRPYEVLGHALRTSASIGVCLYPDDGDCYEELMKNADLALYDAKGKGRNNFQFFRSELNVATSRRRKIESRLYLAFEHRRLALHYQPQILQSNGQVCGVEALLRWHDSELGWVPPDQFVPIAEDTGLILAIGAWVLDEACRQLKAWQMAGITGVSVAINLSLHQFRQAGLPRLVADALARHQLRGADLVIELTESVAMQNPEATIEILQALRAQGVCLAVDDFGTGYSSLAYLKVLPIQRLKLDKSFVRDIETDANDAAICSATIAMAHAMGLGVIAEGVETQAQQDYLASLGCDVMQGFLLGRPMPAEQVFPAPPAPAGAQGESDGFDSDR